MSTGTKARQTAFLAAFCETASITRAAKAAKVHRRLHYDWLLDPGYLLRFDRATDQATAILEDEAVRRANEGVPEFKYYKGQLCYRQKWNEGTLRWERYGKPLAVVRYSDALMMFMLRGLKPEKYRERTTTELVGKGGEELSLQVVFVKSA